MPLLDESDINLEIENLPEWNYNGIGDLVPGCGYLTKFNSEVSFNYNLD